MNIYEIYKKNGTENSKDLKGKMTIEFMLSLMFSHFCFSNYVNSEVQLVYSDSEFNRQPLLRYRNHKDYGLYLQNFSFELLVKRVSPENILRIVCSLLLERKIILLFQNYQQNAVIMESIISLLSPLYYILSCKRFIANGTFLTFLI